MRLNGLNSKFDFVVVFMCELTRARYHISEPEDKYRVEKWVWIREWARHSVSGIWYVIGNCRHQPIILLASDPVIVPRRHKCDRPFQLLEEPISTPKFIFAVNTVSNSSMYLLIIKCPKHWNWQIHGTYSSHCTNIGNKLHLDF